MQEQILTIEQIMLHAMPAEKDLQVGDWKLRLNGRYTYRANCVCPFHYMKTEQTVQKISLCEKIFYQNRIPAVFKVTPVRQPGLAELLTARDYQKVKTVHVMAASLNMMSAGRSADIYVQSRPSEEWISASLALSGVWESHMAALHSQMICRWFLALSVCRKKKKRPILLPAK
ncbi:hypothetical protein B6259_03300 [Ruminococcaceae bacterium CPB6]|nr:hypothetical protein B6259_03300 [Ruminococcaceae bacterium CPB6]